MNGASGEYPITVQREQSWNELFKASQDYHIFPINPQPYITHIQRTGSNILSTSLESGTAVVIDVSGERHQGQKVVFKRLSEGGKIEHLLFSKPSPKRRFM